MRAIKKTFSYISSLFPTFDPLIVEPKLGPEQILNSLNTLPKEYLDPDIMEIAQAAHEGNIRILLDHINDFHEIGSIKIESQNNGFIPKYLGTVCLIELCRIIQDSIFSI